jgi:hypothetical protein
MVVAIAFAASIGLLVQKIRGALAPRRERRAVVGDLAPDAEDPAQP